VALECIKPRKKNEISDHESLVLATEDGDPYRRPENSLRVGGVKVASGESGQGVCVRGPAFRPR
jgi:hypothetical protein